MKHHSIGICIVGEGAMGHTHAEVLSKLPGVRLAALAAGDPAVGDAFARRWHIPFASTRIEDCLARDDVDAVVVASPSGLHVAHGLLAAAAGKAALIEIPASLTLAGAERLAAAQRAAGTPMMLAHSRRFSPAHRHLRDRMRAGSFRLHHLVVETYFLRRTNLNMLGRPRSWTDHLLWHHACHSIDLAAWLLEGEDFDVWGQQGPKHPTLGIAMDMSIGMRGLRSGALVTMALSFNNKGPFGGFYRYIGEEDTCRVFRDELTDGEGRRVPLEGAAFALQDADFIDALRTGRTPESDIHAVLPAMRLLERIDRCMVTAG
jgi:2-hydroxy-4-carboxymuconate semialdehyde hemiacetal dehydrogenase